MSQSAPTVLSWRSTALGSSYAPGGTEEAAAMGMVNKEWVWRSERCQHDDVDLSDCMATPCSLRDAPDCDRSRRSLLDDRRTADALQFIAIATEMDPSGHCAAPLGDQLADVLPRMNALLRSMRHHEGDIPVGRGLLALAPRGPLDAIGTEDDDSPWVRALTVLATSSMFHLARAAEDPCHMVRLAVVLNPRSAEALIGELTLDVCPQVARVARHVVGRDDLRPLEPTALLLRMERCDCRHDCSGTRPSPSAAPAVEVTERAMDILLRLVEGSRNVRSIRATSSGSGLGWAFGVCSGMNRDPEQLLLLVDPAGRVARPDAGGWQDLPVGEALAWAAMQPDLTLEQAPPPTSLRVGILAGDAAVRSVLASSLVHIGHLLLADGVTARLRPFLIDGILNDPDASIDARRTSDDWMMEVSLGGDPSDPSPNWRRTEATIFSLRKYEGGIRGLYESTREVVEARRSASTRTSVAAWQWRDGRLPLVITRENPATFSSDEEGFVVETVEGPARRAHVSCAYIAAAPPPDGDCPSFVDLTTVGEIDPDTEFFLVVEDGEDLATSLGLEVEHDGRSQSLPLRGQPVEVAGVGTFVWTRAGWCVVRELESADGAWLSGYRHAFGESIVRELGVFRGMIRDVAVPGPKVDSFMGPSEELVSLLGEPDAVVVTALRYEFAIAGVVDAERRGWIWTRCHGGWSDCSGGGDPTHHGCGFHTDMVRHIVQPWALSEVLRIWDRAGCVPTMLADLAERRADELFGHGQFRPADREQLSFLNLQATIAGVDAGERTLVEDLLHAPGGALVEELFRTIVLMLDAVDWDGASLSMEWPPAS
jgi:hypothetical protein